MSYWKGKRVLITGADGFVGGNLAQELMARSAQVIAIERDGRPTNTLRMLGIYDRVTVARGDICDLAFMSRVLNEYSVTHCFHLAAQALVGVASAGPLSTFETNIRGTYMVLEASRATKGIEGVVVASSDKAYGVHSALPYTEEASLNGLYPYDASKACTDILARSYFVTYGLRIAVTRNANTYGPGDMSFSRIVPDAIRCALRGVPLKIRSDGMMERDYLFVQDAVRGYADIGEALGREEVAGQAFNLGTERPVSVLDICTLIAKLTGSAPPPRVLNVTKYEIPRQYLDASKARRVLGWRPEHTLEQGLHKTIEWYRQLLAREPMLFP